MQENLLPKKAWWCQSESEVKLVTKPWGNATIGGVASVGELWLNYNRGEAVGEQEKRYVMKKLFIRQGTRTSRQYHKNKVETNHLISGVAEAHMENADGVIEVSVFTEGDSWTIPAGRKHHLVARTDLVMLESSTPEVDDVVRVADDTGRGDGRIANEHVENK